MGVTTVFFAVAGLASLGMPGFSGFVAELLVFIGAFRTYPVMAVFGIFGAAITAVYILRLLSKVFFGPISEKWQRLPDATRLESVTTGSLALVLIVVGVYPTYFIKVINSGVLPFIEMIKAV